MKENLFKKVGGEKIDNTINYIIDFLKYNKHDGTNSNIQICIGCDSQPHRKNLTYAITIVMYDDFKHKGAHYIFKRIKMPKSFLKKRKRVSQWHYDKIDEITDNHLMPLNDYITVKLWNEVEYLMELGIWLDEQLQGKYFINHEKNVHDGSIPYRLPIIHLDFNPNEGDKQENKSNKLYSSAMGLFAGMGFKVVSKPNAYASSSAADLLCK